MADTTSTEIARITEVMRSDRGRYDSDPALQSRLRDLYDAQESGQTLSPWASSGERAEIERIMRTDMQRYWRDEAMQERYRQLLEAEEGPDMDEDGRFDLIEMPTPTEWKNDGGNPAEYQQRSTVIREVNDIIRDMSAESRGRFESSFAQLPAGIQSVALGALLDKRAVPIDPLSETAIEELQRIPSYAALIQEWGHEAPSKLAVAKERLWRVLDRLTYYDVRTAINWLDRLPTAAAIALFRKLAR